MNLKLSVYAPFSFDPIPLIVAKEGTITIKIKNDAVSTFVISVNC
jgi:hypothetical protein